MAQQVTRDEFLQEFNTTNERAVALIYQLEEKNDIASAIEFARENDRDDLFGRMMCVMARYTDCAIHTLFSTPHIVFSRLSEETKLHIKDAFIALISAYMSHYTLKTSVLYKSRPLGGWPYTYDAWVCTLVEDGRKIPFN